MSANIREAYDRASAEKTPWNPSKSATARVTNPLPVPDLCPYCKADVACVNNSEIYGRGYGEWPWAYRRMNTGCGAYVGLHPFTAIPLGTLADAPTREARRAAKDAFNPLWQSALRHGRRKVRTHAYVWLATQLGIDPDTCHIGWFDVPTCLQVLDVCRAIPKNQTPWET